jgi:hypothetical protein
MNPQQEWGQLDVAVTLLAPSAWALSAVPIGLLALTWGAILPEERYLRAKFGAEQSLSGPTPHLSALRLEPVLHRSGNIRRHGEALRHRE